jgi:cytochrome P450
MRRQAVPGPKGNFFLGNMLQLQRGFLLFMRESAKQYGDIVQFRVGLSHFYLLNHPDYVHEVLVNQADKFYKTRVVKQVLNRTFGNGLVTSDGDFHKRQRQLVQPSLHPRRIETYAQVMVDHTLRMLDTWQTNQVVDIQREMTNLTLGIVAETLFGANVAETADQVATALTSVVEILNKKLGAVIRAPSWLPTPHNLEERAASKTLDTILMRIIEERKAAGTDKGDFISMLLLAADEASGQKMTDKQVHDEAMTLFLGGHETTTIVLTWVWYLLSQHPNVEAKVLDEMNTVLGGRLPTPADLPHLKYTTQVIHEVMRLYPPLWLFNREAVDEVIIDGYRIRKGETVYILPYMLHHDARFFEQPERFMPERFTEGNEKQIPRYAYLPFGGGPRVCVGQSFAMTEIKLILATVLPRFQFSLVPGQEVKPKTSATLRPKHSIAMELTAREFLGQPSVIG